MDVVTPHSVLGGVLCLHRGVVKKEVAVLCRRRKSGSLPEKEECCGSLSEKEECCGSLPEEGRVVLYRHQGVVLGETQCLLSSKTRTRELESQHTKLQFILTHPYAYNIETFLQFLANMRITPESTRLSSFVLQQRVQITKEDLGKYLHLRTEGVRAHSMSLESEYNWTAVNQVLRGLDQICHLPRVYTLNQNARIIQHVLRSTVIPKAGDRINMTPLLSCVTYLIMADTPFDEAQLILDYLQSLTDIRHPSAKRKKNIALGHLVCYVLEKKYSLIHPNPPTEEPIFFTNASFRALFSHGSDSGEEEEQEPQGAPAPVPAPAQDQNAFQNLAQRFGQLETHFDQHFDQLENRLDAHINRYNADMAWMRG
ncbi:hypothetical protein M5K25_003965 [Dendrobium thyrsiflorum]|uniref:Uncharacterized protein n=1 Tax=Dendrobium thyrsiflorum TaxID=117978 RepID=A0ABD0VKL3_DENTH